MTECFDTLRDTLTYIEPDQIQVIEKAYNMAEKAHAGQKRRSGGDYIEHPLAVAQILAEMRMDQRSIMAGLLHDTIEDTHISKRDISQAFSEELAELVDGLSKIGRLQFSSAIDADAENFRKMLMAMAKDIRVIIVKLADRLHNMRTIEVMKRETQRRKSEETLQIFAPIARRLGMHLIALELENLSFKTLYPKRYNVLNESVDKVQGDHRHLLEEIKQRMRDKLEATGIEVSAITVRQKALYSIYRKMRLKRLSFSEITDVHAIRIITSSVDDCYRALGVVHGMYKPVPERFRDYIALPKPNEYQSLHTILFGPHGTPIEVQIRTVDMHQMADRGVSAHWAYKSGVQAKQSQLHAQASIRQWIDMQSKAGSSKEFLDNVKVDLFPEDVYVFTPKGKIIELPVGATVIDFAYMLHTDLGNACVAAKIDRQLAPLSTELVSGQTVEIITAPGARPSPSWLSFVATGKARSSIRHYIKTQQRDGSKVLGQRLLDKALSGLGGSLAEQSDAERQAIADSFGCQKFADLLESIGLGSHAPGLVARKMLLGTVDEEGAEESSKPLAIDGAEGMIIEYATCCYPLPGDPITGVLQSGCGMRIHRENCQRIVRLSVQSDARVPICWADYIQEEFMVAICATVKNDRGVLARLAVAVHEAGGFIKDVEIEGKDSQSPLVTFHLLVRDRIHLADIIKEMRRLPQRPRVWRYAFRDTVQRGH